MTDTFTRAMPVLGVADDPDGHIIAFGVVPDPDPLGPGLGSRIGRDAHRGAKS